LPVIALPTTAGSGAEITNNAVLTDPETRVKKSLRSPLMVPAAAVVDAELTLSQPPDLTAWSGLDALTQAIESYLSLTANAASRALARQAVAQLMRHLPAAVHNGQDREVRTAVAEGSLLSAMAFSQGGLGAAHGLAHPLGLGLGLAHGFTCAILLPHVLRWNAAVCAGQLGELAQAVNVPDAAAFVASVSRLCQELHVPDTFAGTGLSGDHFPAILANCRTASMKANPRPMSDEDVRNLLTILCG
jgi:alcohol dehydrogenase class IV